jgi:ankyrin repeat protein
MEHQDIKPYTLLPPDLWNKIIACCPNTTKNSLAQTCLALSLLSKKTNLSIYMHSPLILSEKQRAFALYCATHYGNRYAVENLLQHGASPNYITPYLQSLPLTVAEANKNQDIISLLKQYYVIPHSLTPPMYSRAVYVGDLPLLNSYLENSTNSLHYKGAYHSNPILHSAIYNGHTHIIKRLLKDPQIKPYLEHAQWNEMKPLYFAAQCDRPAIIELLLEACPTMINHVCKQGFSALHVAVRYNNYHAAAALVKHPLVKVNLCSFDRNSPLHTAIRNANVNMVTLLLSSPNICVNIKNKAHQTPLNLAKELFRADIQNLLINKGAKTFFYLSKIKQWDGETKKI